jgi:hypothetical protein
MNEKLYLKEKHLHTIFTIAQAAILWRIIRYIKNNDYCVLDKNGGKYIRKTLKEWIGDIEFYKNQKLRKFTENGLLSTLKTLCKLGFLEKQSSESKKTAYEVKEQKLLETLSHAFPFLDLDGKTSFSECEIDDGGISL